MGRKPEIVYREKYRKGLVIKKEDVLVDIKNSKRIELVEAGKFQDGNEYVTVKIIV